MVVSLEAVGQFLGMRIWWLVPLLLMAWPAGGERLGIVGQAAPAWQVDRWFHLPGGMKALEPADLEGRVIYLYFFQSWCPGCHSHGFPSLQAVEERFRDDPEVVFVAVQTVFEGHGTNTEGRARDTVEEYGLHIPVGHAAGEGDRSPGIMRRYRTGGTPWTVVIDRGGRVRFNGFTIEPEAAISMVEKLLAQR